jgi:outer membrane protein assembly factor BamB
MKVWKLFKFASFVFLILSSALLNSPNASAEAGWNTFKGSSSRAGTGNDSPELPLKILWQYPVNPKSNGFVDWGPVAGEGMIFSPDGLNHILALDAETGKLIWEKELISNTFTVTLSEDKKVLLATTAITTKPTPTLYALNPKTGEKLWDNTINGQPAMGGMEGAPVIDGNRVYVGYLQYEGNGGIAAFEISTGKLLWQWKVPRFSPYSALAYSKGKIFVGFENKTIHCINAASGKPEWSLGDLPDLPYGAQVATKKELYFVAGSSIYAVDSQKGQILWKKELSASVGHSSVSLHKNVLYFGSKESKLFAASAVNGDIIWEVDLASGSLDSSPIIDEEKGTLFIGSQKNILFAINIKTGEVKNQIQLSDNQRGIWRNTPAIYKNRIYIGSLDRTFYALEKA